MIKAALIAEVEEDASFMDAPDDGPDPWAPGGILHARSLLDAGHLSGPDLALVFQTYLGATPPDMWEYQTKLLNREVEPICSDERANHEKLFLMLTYDRFQKRYHGQPKPTKGDKGASDRAYDDTADAYNKAFKQNISGGTVRRRLTEIRLSHPAGILRRPITN